MTKAVAASAGLATCRQLPGAGNSPVMIHRDQLAAIVDPWTDLSFKIKQDKVGGATAGEAGGWRARVSCGLHPIPGAPMPAPSSACCYAAEAPALLHACCRRRTKRGAGSKRCGWGRGGRALRAVLCFWRRCRPGVKRSPPAHPPCRRYAYSIAAANAPGGPIWHELHPEFLVHPPW